MATTPRYTTEASPDVTTASSETDNHGNHDLKKWKMFQTTVCGTLLVVVFIW